MQLFQAPNENDHSKQDGFLNHFSEALKNEDLSIDDIVFSDECHSYLNGMMNKQNCTAWGTEKPQGHEEASLHSPKITVWRRSTLSLIYSPYFLKTLILKWQ